MYKDVQRCFYWETQQNVDYGYHSYEKVADAITLVSFAPLSAEFEACHIVRGRPRTFVPVGEYLSLS
jgi:hypothetical protein